MQKKLWLHAVGGVILPLPRAALPFGCFCIVKPGRLQARLWFLLVGDESFNLASPGQIKYVNYARKSPLSI
ncbi:hypothetical protein SCA6_010162 [Theobroma cacao]